jgi:hypothetical protein
MSSVPPVIVGVFVVAISTVVASPCETQNHTIREVLDCADSLDPNGACRTFVAAYERFVETDKISDAPEEDQERFLFEGGDRLLTYAIQPKRSRDARLSAAGRAEVFLRHYIEWFSNLTEQQSKKLSNGGRVRSVMRHLGNALIAQERKGDIHEAYSFWFLSKGASVFGPEAMALWEQALKDTYGPPKEVRNVQPPNPQWQEFGKCLAEWANLPGMLRAGLRDHYIQRSDEILGKLL